MLNDRLSPSPSKYADIGDLQGRKALQFSSKYVVFGVLQCGLGRLLFSCSMPNETRGVLLRKPLQFSPKKLAIGLCKSSIPDGVLQAASDGVLHNLDPTLDGVRWKELGQDRALSTASRICLSWMSFAPASFKYFSSTAMSMWCRSLRFSTPANLNAPAKRSPWPTLMLSSSHSLMLDVTLCIGNCNCASCE